MKYVALILLTFSLQATPVHEYARELCTLARTDNIVAFKALLEENSQHSIKRIYDEVQCQYMNLHDYALANNSTVIASYLVEQGIHRG
jgi:hypothetical protein